MKRYNKDLVKLRFENSFPTYDEHAVVQRQMAEKLADYIFASCGENYNKVLEIGCGTGFLTKHIMNDFKVKKLLINDISPGVIAYIEKIAPYCNFLIGDMENMVFDTKFNIVASNAAFQWAEDLRSMINRFYHVLNTDGVLAFTTFGERNFEQISKISNRKLMYKNLDKLEPMFGDFEVKILKEEVVELEFKSPVDVLRHIKGIGANAMAAEFWTKGVLKDFEKKYREYSSTANGVSLTYHPIYVVLKKKN
ncbi:MAG: malonyl-ACP O-methyltransferase BioC [bacterium]